MYNIGENPAILRKKTPGVLYGVQVMGPGNKIYALKRIRLTGCERDTVSGFEDEIRLLTRLKGRGNIVQLIDFEVIRAEGVIYMLLECGEIDLAHLLTKQVKKKKKTICSSE